MIKLDGTVFYFVDRLLRIGQAALLIQYFHNTLCRRACHGHHNKYHGDHHQTHKNLYGVSKQTHQISGGHGAISNDHLCADPGDQKNTGVHCKLHHRLVHDDQTLCMDTHLLQIVCSITEFLIFMVFPHIRFHHADTGQILLNAGIQLIIAFEHLIKDRKCVAYDKCHHAA